MPAYHCSRTVASWVILNRLRKGCPPDFILQVMQQSLARAKLIPSKLSTTQGKWALTHAAVLYFHTAFANSTRQPRMKLYRNSTTSGSNQHPSLLRGMQLTCGLQDFMMSLHHQTDGQIARWLAGPTKAAFHPSIHRSIDRVRLGQQLHLASPSGITTDFYKLLCNKAHYMLAGFHKTFSNGKLNRYVRSSVDCFSKRNGTQCNGMDSRITPLPSLNKCKYH